MQVDVEDRPDPLWSVLEEAWDPNNVSRGFTKPFSDFYRLFEILSDKANQNVRISRAQEKSFWMLWHWWTSYRSSCKVLKGPPSTDYIRHSAEGVSYELRVDSPHVDSLHFNRLLNLFEQEFGGPGFVQYGAHLMTMRQEAAKYSACQHVSLHCYRSGVRRPNNQLRKLELRDYEARLDLSPSTHTILRDGKVMLGENALPGLHPCCPIGATLQACNWLPESDGLPYYLWDRVQQKVISREQLDRRPAYTAISHTWGRWQKQDEDPVEIRGLEYWKVPQNTVFEVRKLPEILAEVPTSTRYVWFDLVCIPQDGSPKANEEIARQAAIFNNAEHAIIWLNRVYTWKGLEKAVEYMCMVFLHADPLDYLSTDNEATGLFEEYRFEGGIKREDVTTDGWFSSLWTLQEICLRPDMWLCNAKWEIFSVADHTVPIAMDTIVALNQECTSILDGRVRLLPIEESAVGPLLNESLDQVAPNEMFGKLIAFGLYPRGYLELGELLNRTGMLYLHFMRRDLILLLGSHRFCKGLRAEAIMSVVGSVTWKDTHGADSNDLVLGQYPLGFVQEAYSSIGANFFGSISISSNSLSSLEHNSHLEPQGSLMPFEAKIPGTEEKLVVDWIFLDEVPSPAVATWQILQTGSVQIPHASIFCSSSARYTSADSGEIVCNVWLTHESPDVEKPRFPNFGRSRRYRTVELRSWLRDYFPFSDNYAVELCRLNAGSGSRGILLKEIYKGSRTMLKIGNYISSTYSPLTKDRVSTGKLDWVVL
ncbi:hypothetical protein BU26DRAFT_600990 [Trematosphaeria pertusa]|uniref:Heterokaryon incompatibility domain-containing protein n=1 Tax=Trematosphaeria pertusa TaxID=390896 RepID=A0A6A6IQA6_9PLEO|nr:uncharacterized protein BU26DRAFT_600990 [Trematosphaeria pertusa]KAF2252735.1 hypothetical protein BU26DRAFT_600990 [Trematosphaeria pertusa]